METFEQENETSCAKTIKKKNDGFSTFGRYSLSRHCRSQGVSTVTA